MKYLLDTNVCVGFLNQRRPLLTQRFLSVPTLDNDMQIAAIALANNLTLVTHNTAEFSRIPDLALDDWE